MSEVANAPVVGRSRFRRLGWVVAALVVAAAGVVLWQKLAQKPPPRAAPPQIVKVAQAVLGDMPVVLNELGTVMPTATVTVMPNQAVSGYLVRRALSGRPGRPRKASCWRRSTRARSRRRSTRPSARCSAIRACSERGEDGPHRFQKLVTLKFMRASRPKTRPTSSQQNEGTVKLDQAAVDTARSTSA